MTPFEAFEQGNPLVLVHPHAGDRAIAACWPEQMDGVDGFAWADLGWDTNDSSFLFHFIPGPINGDREQWEIGPRETSSCYACSSRGSPRWSIGSAGVRGSRNIPRLRRSAPGRTLGNPGASEGTIKQA
jgi:hypothetical protein